MEANQANENQMIGQVDAMLAEIRAAFTESAAPLAKLRAADACLALHARIHADGMPDVFDLLLERLLPLAPPSTGPVTYAPRIVPGTKR